MLPQIILLHTINFSLSLMFLLAFGFVVLVFGGKMKPILIAGVLVVVVDLVYEIFLPILNTVDIADAFSDILGTAVAYVYRICLKAKGLIAK